MLSLVDVGHNYINRTKCGEHSPVPLEEALSVLRKLLSTLGFTPTTSNVGLDYAQVSTNNVVGGEAALAEILVAFRDQIRSVAIRQMKVSNVSDESKTDAKELLRYCDDVRNASSTVGLELLDTKVDSNDDKQLKWRWCSSPNEKTDNSKNLPQSNERSSGKLSSQVSIYDLFRVGSYEGMFSEYDDLGMPTQKSDGTPMSKSGMKKLKKKRDKYERKLLGLGNSF